MGKREITYGEILEKACQYSSLTAWANAKGSSYSTACVKGWVQDIVIDAGLKRKKKIKESLNFKEIVEVASEYKTIKEWKEGHGSSYHQASRKGFLSEVILQANLITHGSFDYQKYSFDDYLEDAKQFKNKREWMTNGKTYKHAKRLGKIEEICQRVGFVNNNKKLWWYNIQ